MGFVGCWNAGSFGSTATCVSTVADVGMRAAAVKLFADDVLQIIADVALTHGHAHRKRHDVTLGLLLVVGGEGVLDHANLRAVAMGDDDLVAVLNEVGDGLGRHMDGIHLLMQILAKGVARPAQ